MTTIKESILPDTVITLNHIPHCRLLPWQPCIRVNCCQQNLQTFKAQCVCVVPAGTESGRQSVCRYCLLLFINNIFTLQLRIHSHEMSTLHSACVWEGCHVLLIYRMELEWHECVGSYTDNLVMLQNMHTHYIL